MGCREKKNAEVCGYNGTKGHRVDSNEFEPKGMVPPIDDGHFRRRNFPKQDWTGVNP
jgi:hypothetical protein